MRRIPIDQLRPSQNWLKRADDAQRLVSRIARKIPTATEEKRLAVLATLRKAISKYSKLWADLKGDLAALSSGKCWYCESRENRSDLAVDHFRPKSKVKECLSHCGYWWLAFDPLNYRFACDLCNSLHSNEEAEESLGKGTHFPLLDEGNRVFDPSNSVAIERPTLLDPTLPGDPALLWFLDDGTATSRYSASKSPMFSKRAEISISVYNLNDVRIREERRAIANEIKLQVARGERYLDDALNADGAAYELFKESYRVIQRMICEEAVCSSAARAVLAGYRDKEWVVSILTTA
jgi:hypothetical protein